MAFLIVLARVLLWFGVAVICAAAAIILLAILTGKNRPRWFGLTATTKRTVACERRTEAVATPPCSSVPESSADHSVSSDTTGQDPSAEHTLIRSDGKVVFIDFTQRRSRRSLTAT